jgi:methanogenic corrinoid protein MtbC1
MKKTVLSTADVARLFSVTETTVKRWADEGALKCQKTLGGHRKFIIKYVIEFAEKNNLEPMGVLQMPDKDEQTSRLQLAVLERDMVSLVSEFVNRALAQGDADLPHFFSYLYEHKIPLWQIYDEIVRNGMREIGDRWEKGEVRVDQEHRASYETMDALTHLQSQIRMEDPNGRSVVLACVGEEMHEMGLRTASYLFESYGWQTQYIGARTPVESVVRSIREYKPEAVCISATQLGVSPVLGDQLREVAEVSRSIGARTFLGGRAAQEQAYAPELYDYVIHCSHDLVTILDSWVGTS